MSCDRILCKDMDCEFKCSRELDHKMLNECLLSLDTAIDFFKKFQRTTCELGCRELNLDQALHNKLINNIKKRGHV